MPTYYVIVFRCINLTLLLFETGDVGRLRNTPVRSRNHLEFLQVNLERTSILNCATFFTRRSPWFVVMYADDRSHD